MPRLRSPEDVQWWIMVSTTTGHATKFISVCNQMTGPQTSRTIISIPLLSRPGKHQFGYDSKRDQHLPAVLVRYKFRVISSKTHL